MLGSRITIFDMFYNVPRNNIDSNCACLVNFSDIITSTLDGIPANRPSFSARQAKAKRPPRGGRPNSDNMRAWHGGCRHRQPASLPPPCSM
jgi:hypothetical protein